MSDELFELIDRAIEKAPEHVIQITKMTGGDFPATGEWRVGWELKEWPYVAARQEVTLPEAIRAAITLMDQKSEQGSQ